MKQFSMGLFALVLSLGAVAFTNKDVNNSPKADSFWFPLDPTSGNQIPQSTPPPNSASDTNTCPAGMTSYCSRQYGAIEVVPNSSPVKYRGVATTAGTTHKKL